MKKLILIVLSAILVSTLIIAGALEFADILPTEKDETITSNLPESINSELDGTVTARWLSDINYKSTAEDIREVRQTFCWSIDSIEQCEERTIIGDYKVEKTHCKTYNETIGCVEYAEYTLEELIDRGRTEQQEIIFKSIYNQINNSVSSFKSPSGEKTIEFIHKAEAEPIEELG